MGQKSLTLHKFRTQRDVDQWVHGSDASNGGLSTSNFELCSDGQGARFHGKMSLEVKPEFEGMYRGGFAGIKTRVSRSSTHIGLHLTDSTVQKNPLWRNFR